MKRRKTSALMSKATADKGVPKPGKIIGTYNIGDRVCIRPSNYQIDNAPHRRYCGKVGVVEWVSQRKTFGVKVKLTDRTTKMIQTKYVHLLKLK